MPFSNIPVGDLWQSKNAHTDWVSVEDANESASRSCCDRVRCDMTHYTPDQPEYSVHGTEDHTNSDSET